jgi:hypothetical protein
MRFAVNTADVATPDALVVAFPTFVPLGNIPLAPVDGAVKVTTRLLTRFPRESLTVATSLLANGWPAVMLCPDPLVAMIDAGGPAVFVSAKLAGV